MSVCVAYMPRGRSTPLSGLSDWEQRRRWTGRLGNGRRNCSMSQMRRVTNGSVFDLSKFAILGHVAHRGDVAVSSGEWIAGPDSPSAIEGLEVQGLQGGIQIDTQVLFGSRPPKWSNWVSSGSFVGTRGRRMPLVGVRLKLVGRDADQHELFAEALFLGSPIINKRGREIEMVSAAGADSLVGLRLQVRRSAMKSARVGRNSERTSARTSCSRLSCSRASLRRACECFFKIRGCGRGDNL